MQCHICGNRLDSIDFDEEDKILPCNECLSAVQEVVDDYDEENPAEESEVVEETLGDDEALSNLKYHLGVED